MAKKSRCFHPIARPDARVLILGSLPGRMSLERQQYYAQPRNAFWRVMGELTGATPDVPYLDRLLLLQECGIAVWDVCAAGHREGSLDSSIELSTVEANDFRAFLRAHSAINLICFNGKKSKEIYDRKVQQKPAALFQRVRHLVLPSTSPAHAGMRFEDKLSHWRAALEDCIKLQGPRAGAAPRVSSEQNLITMESGYENYPANSFQTQTAV